MNFKLLHTILFIVTCSVNCIAGPFYTKWKHDTTYSIYGEKRIRSIRFKKRSKPPIRQEKYLFYNPCGELVEEQRFTIKRDFVPNYLKSKVRTYDTKSCFKEKQWEKELIRHQNHLSIRLYNDSAVYAENLTGDSLKIHLFNAYGDTLNTQFVKPFGSSYLESLKIEQFVPEYVECFRKDSVIGRFYFKDLFEGTEDFSIPVFHTDQIQSSLTFNHDTIKGGNLILGNEWFAKDIYTESKVVKLTKEWKKASSIFTFSPDGYLDIETGKSESGEFEIYESSYYKVVNNYIICRDVHDPDQIWGVYKIEHKSKDSLLLRNVLLGYYSRDFSVTPIVDFSPDNSFYFFPKFNSDNKILAKKINNEMVHDFLDVDPNTYRFSVFENRWGNGDGLPGLETVYGYQINFSNKKVFSLTIEAEGCGAYCEPYEVSYTFDLNSGNKVELQDLIEPQKQKELLTFIKNQRVAEIDSILKENLKTNIDSISDPDEAEYITMQRELYQECIKEDYYNDLDRMYFELYENHIIVKLGRCSAHYNRNVDEIGDFIIRVKYEDLKPYLSDYGKQILFNE